MTTPTAPTYKYDAFISYKHGDPDEAFARQLLRDLEAAGYKVALDKRDFVSNASVLEEMERCIKESRFTLAVVSARYLESGFTGEEMVMQKTLDMAERKRRIIPLLIEHVILPTWMFGTVSIDFAEVDPIMPPLEKLKRDLGTP